MVQDPFRVPITTSGQAEGEVRLGTVAEEILVQVPLGHPLEYKALRLVLGDHPQQADNVGVSQVRHHFALSLEVSPGVCVSSRLESLYSHKAGHSSHDAPQLPPVHFPEGPVPHLLHEPHSADGELPSPHLLNLHGGGAAARGQKRIHLHLRIVVVRVGSARVDEASTDELVKNIDQLIFTDTNLGLLVATLSGFLWLCLMQQIATMTATMTRATAAGRTT